jgi:hypothetical protein
MEVMYSAASVIAVVSIPHRPPFRAMYSKMALSSGGLPVRSP